jgi:hypothetical protein
VICRGRKVDAALAIVGKARPVYTARCRRPRASRRRLEPCPTPFQGHRPRRRHRRPLRRSTEPGPISPPISPITSTSTTRLREMIDVWGADHGGYVKRLQAVVRA